ncbi:MAG: putative 2OG-Fe(II) oxygenase [Pseudomonadota bacterium]
MAANRAERRRQAKLAKKAAKGGKLGTNGAANPVAAILKEADVLYKAKKLPETLEKLEEVSSLDSTRHDVLSTAGLIAFDLGEYEKAEQNYRLAVTVEPKNVKAQFGLGLTLKLLGRFEESAEALRESVKLSGAEPETVRRLIEVLWQLGASVEIPALCDTLLQREPHNLEAAMYQAAAHFHRGTPEKARALLGFEDLVEIHDLEAPDGYEDMKAFNKALADHVVSHPTMAVPDKADATYHNDDLHITRELVGPGGDEGHTPVKDLEALIASKIATYLETRKDTLDHGFIKRWPENNHLTAWGTLLKGQGNLAPHIHLQGYLGMVYYPELPQEMASEAANTGDDQRGFLELGRLPDEFPVPVETDIHLIQPKEGRLVIFPGYFFHRTIPFESADRRISIAFDVVAD